MSIETKEGIRWTYKEYAAIPADGLRHEILNGDHVMNPAPNLYHQLVSRRIQFQLYSAVELTERGYVMDAPVDVELSLHNIVQPDLVVVRKAKGYLLTPSRVKGVPDLLIEILSPSNADYDRKIKRDVYLACGVPEYWIVAPDDHEVTRLRLKDGQYAESRHTDAIPFDIPPEMQVDLRQVW